MEKPMFYLELQNGYEIRQLETAEFLEVWKAHGKSVFDGSTPTFHFREALSEVELAKANGLREQYGERFRLNLTIYRHAEVVGWSWGFQDANENFYMCNSAILPAHRGQGLYRALVAAMIGLTKDLGFQKLHSRHMVTNNAVIVPKLKEGFVITGLELSDTYGTLVTLTYFPNALRRKVLDYRAGQSTPDDEVKTHLRL
jgi:ribosomal protein S18 acetylase RimI-like enzyme